jgi:Nitrogen regulatory protein PII
MNNNEIKALYIVANAGFSDDIIDIARKEGIRGATIVNARGEGSHHESIMGITIDSEREMLICITDSQSAERAMAAIQKEAGIKTPKHAICFIMPVEKAVGLINADEDIGRRKL